MIAQIVATSIKKNSERNMNHFLVLNALRKPTEETFSCRPSPPLGAYRPDVARRQDAPLLHISMALKLACALEVLPCGVQASLTSGATIPRESHVKLGPTDPRIS
jgi:hypothetical protein